MNLLSGILAVYVWVVAAAIIAFLFAIARFYERKSGKRSYYWAYPIVIALFGVATARYLFLTPAIAGDMWADSLYLVGGVGLGVFSILLLRMMIDGR